jgi:hypothetical protein
VFGNGTKFVWHGGSAQEEHVIEGSLVIEVKAGLITVHEAEGRFVSEAGEGVGHAIEGVGGGLCAGFIIEHAGFDRPGAAQTPVGGDHLLDETELHAIGGLEAKEVLIDDNLESFRGFIAHDDLAGEKTVVEGILRRTLLAQYGDGAFGKGTIDLRSTNPSK